ncbi:response regulator [Sorangium sp. So ce388]|uniref:Two-component response regulator n=1 Tax=Sorangium cellulosum TaxID=56 RepID=A0A150RVZ2_SORCE|nr:two-component response regulator [Sorangium cellulosum]
MSADLPLVLVLDDDDDTSTLLGMALRRRGFRVVVARSCEEGRARLAENPIDALVTDVSLPDGSGIELVASLAAKPRATIVVSGFGGDDDREKSRMAGAHAHLVKPVDVTRLVSTLNEMLGRPS